jgi:hypothetical protein
MALLDLEMALKPMSAACPGVHFMPAASCWGVDQLPLPHCWNDVPPMQFHNPSVAQGPLKTPSDPPAGGDGAIGDGDGAALGACGGATTEEAVGAGAAVGDGGLSPPGAGTVMKTPPGIVGFVVGGEVSTGAAVAVGAATGGDGGEPGPAAVPHPPSGSLKSADPLTSTADPGLGNRTFLLSGTRHEPPMLATNMSGKAL